MPPSVTPGQGLPPANLEAHRWETFGEGIDAGKQAEGNQQGKGQQARHWEKQLTPNRC